MLERGQQVISCAEQFPGAEGNVAYLRSRIPSKLEYTGERSTYLTISLTHVRTRTRTHTHTNSNFPETHSMQNCNEVYTEL